MLPANLCLKNVHSESQTFLKPLVINEIDIDEKSKATSIDGASVDYEESKAKASDRANKEQDKKQGEVSKKDKVTKFFEAASGETISKVLLDGGYSLDKIYDIVSKHESERQKASFAAYCVHEKRKDEVTPTDRLISRYGEDLIAIGRAVSVNKIVQTMKQWEELKAGEAKKQRKSNWEALDKITPAIIRRAQKRLNI